MPFFNISRTSTRSNDSSKSDLLVQSLHYVPSNSGSLALKPTVSGMKAEMLDDDDQAWGSAPSHHHGKRFFAPVLGSSKSKSGSS